MNPNKKKLKKVDLIKTTISTLGFSQRYINKVTDSLISILFEIIKEKNYLNIKNFGTFRVLYKKERIGRNPKTKKNYFIKARKSISFKSSKKLSKNYIHVQKQKS